MAKSICTNCENCDSCTLRNKSLIYDCNEFADHKDKIPESQSLADLRFLVISGEKTRDYQPAVMR